MSSHGRHSKSQPAGARRGLLRRGPTVAVAASLVLVVSAGAAIAAWTATGTGNAGAKASTFQALTVTVSTPTALLYPGGTGDARMSVTNPNPFAVQITQVAQDVSIGKFVSSDQGANCTDANATHPTGVTLTTATGSPLGTIAAGGTGTITLAGKVAMSNASDTLCQGAVFTIPATVTATS